MSESRFGRRTKNIFMRVPLPGGGHIDLPGDIDGDGDWQIDVDEWDKLPAEVRLPLETFASAVCDNDYLDVDDVENETGGIIFYKKGNPPAPPKTPDEIAREEAEAIASIQNALAMENA